MGLFGRSREVVFDSGRRTRRSTVPRWFLLLVAGALIGALGVLWAQQRFGPVRLTVEQSHELAIERERALAQMRKAEAVAGSARKTAENLVAESTTQLESAMAELGKRTGELTKASETIDRLSRDIVLYSEVMPPDPRENPIGVRAARLERDNGNLNYHVLLTRNDANARPFTGVMQLVVSGHRASGALDSVTLGPVPVRVGEYQHVKGSMQLPKGFDARQTSIQVLDRPEGDYFGVRVINVQ